MKIRTTVAIVALALAPLATGCSSSSKTADKTTTSAGSQAAANGSTGSTAGSAATADGSTGASTGSSIDANGSTGSASDPGNAQSDSGPCRLVDLAGMQTATGILTTSAPAQDVTGKNNTCVYTPQGQAAMGSIQIRELDDPDALKAYDELLNSGVQTSLDGVGDSAVWVKDTSTMEVRKGDKLLYIMVYGTLWKGGDQMAAAGAVGAAAATNL